MPSAMAMAMGTKTSRCIIKFNSNKIKTQIPIIACRINTSGYNLQLARKGENTDINSREIEIFYFDITQIEIPEVKFRIVCSKGTYIRSIANDFGKALQSGAHLTALRRTKSGDFDLSNAVSPEEFAETIKKISLL